MKLLLLFFYFEGGETVFVEVVVIVFGANFFVKYVAIVAVFGLGAGSANLLGLGTCWLGFLTTHFLPSAIPPSTSQFCPKPSQRGS